MADGSHEKGPEKNKQLGTARTWKKGAAARANGQRGGRPTRWSREVVEVAAACLREYAQRLSVPLQEELVQFAHAVETRNLQMRDRRRPAAAPSKIQVVMQLRVVGRSRVSEGRVEEQVVTEVLRRFEPRRGDGWDYALVLPVMSDLELHELLSVRIPAAIEKIASKRNCTVDYLVRSLDEPARTWTRELPEVVVHQRAELEMVLTCARGKKVLDEVARTVGRRFPLQERDPKAGRYRVAVWYTNAEDLDRIVREIVGEMSGIARAHRRVLGYELRLVGHPDRCWDGVLPEL